MKIATLLSLILMISTFGQSEKTYYFKYNLYRLDSKSENSRSQNKDLIDYLGINKVDTITYELMIDTKSASFSAIDKI